MTVCIKLPPTDVEVQRALEIEKGKKTIDQLMFSEYNEKNMCDVNKGIKLKNFNKTVTKIGKVLQLPDDLKEMIVDAATMDEGKGNAMRMLNFKGANGYLWFGKFAVVKQNDKVSLSYALHGVKFQLGPKEVQPKGVDSFVKFTNAVANRDQKDGHAFINKNGMEHFTEYYLDKATKEFDEKCGDMVKSIDQATKERISKKQSSTDTDQSESTKKQEL